VPRPPDSPQSTNRGCHRAPETAALRHQIGILAVAHHFDAERMCLSFPAADRGMDPGGGGLGRLRDGAVGRPHRDHERHAGAARHRRCGGDRGQSSHRIARCGRPVRADAAKKDAGAAIIEVARKTAAVAADPSNPVALAEKIVAQGAADDAAKLKDTAAEKARIFKHPRDEQIPRWSDLVVNENTKADGTVTREIGVTRFQMLLFTLITAAFVLMNVLTTYVIPEIPPGFLTLMGISNGVYLGAKVTQGS
jgi:hypothetical protein